MFKTLKTTLDIDIAYSVNSFIYVLRKLPIFGDLLTDDAYSSTLLKKVVSIIGLFLSFTKALIFKAIYYFIIFAISKTLFPTSVTKSFFHIYFFLTLIGLFINNKLLATSKKKYFSLILFNMDATKFFRANILWNSIISIILNSICLFSINIVLEGPIESIVILILYTTFIRFVGEALNIIFYKKYNYIWYSNTTLYFTILITLLLLCFLPYLKICLSLETITIITLIVIILGIASLIYLFTIKDYKLIYKKLSQITNVMDSKNEKDYLKQAMVSVSQKDQVISSKKVQGKKGYDLFNTIFFERHREILLQSAKKYSLVFLGIYLILFYLVITQNNYANSIGLFLKNKLSWFVIIMFFINRGSIITQAMFFNCDHAMLRYNFYREPSVILGLFKKRLLTVIKVNLLPASVIALGNVILLIFAKDFSILQLVSTFLFIIFLSIFFSVHYLVIYYLLQPFNKEMEIKKASYSFVTLITYIVSYALSDLVINSTIFSLLGLLFTIIYITIALILVSKLAPKTFRIN